MNASTRWDDIPRLYAEGMSIRQIAEATGLSYGKVHQYLTEQLGELRRRGASKRRHVEQAPVSGRARTHGKRATYRAGCGCDPCCAANTAYYREYHARRRAHGG